MPIYSRNSVRSNETVVANEHYGFSDMGQILVESVQNDMIVFNAVMMNDFREQAALREGTMIGSELDSFREFSLKDAWAGLKAKLKKLWEKIKGVFRQVYAKLGVWFVRNGKAFVAMNRKILANKTGLGDCKIPLYLKRQVKDISSPIAKIRNGAKSLMSGLEKGSKEQSVEDAQQELINSCGFSGVALSGLAEAYKKKVFKEVKDTTFSSTGLSVEELFNTITGRGDAIKELKKAEKEIDKSIKEMVSDLDKKANEANDKKEGSGKKYSNASKVCSAYEKVITIGTRAAISCVKAEVSNARQIVGKLVAYSPNSEAAVLEMAAWCEGADDAATIEDINAEDIGDDDVTEGLEDAGVEINIDIDTTGDECGDNC